MRIWVFTNCDIGLKCEKISSNNNVNTTYYAFNDSISLKEYKKNDSIFVENSIIQKQEDGTILQTFKDGSSKVYINIENNVSMPVRNLF